MMKIWPAGTDCPHPAYQQFKDALNSASYHLADDSGREWNKGYILVHKAVDIAIEHQWPFWAIKRMITEIKSMVDVDLFMSKMLQKLYQARLG